MSDLSPNSLQERQLAWRVAAGDRKAFEELLDRYGPRVQRLARRYAFTESDAEDLTQEIFLDIFRCAANFRGEAQLGTWLYRIALHHCMRHREKAYRDHSHRAPDGASETERPDPSGDPAKRSASRELSHQVHTALEGLSPLHRDVVVLHELHGLTYQECARILEVPVGTVKSRLSNAFRHLRATLGPYVLGEESPGERAMTAEPRISGVHPGTVGGAS
jgi:RNA polymerase sigma-70 factor (ECF subfamily)